MSTWLDPETKALLEKSPPLKLAPPDTTAFTLVVLGVWRRGVDRILRAFRRVGARTDRVAANHLHQKVPLAIQHGLSHSDALLGQFELISCDVISVFIPTEVFVNGDPVYLSELFANLSTSDEFARTNVRITSLPNYPRAEEFVDQFLGDRPALPTTITVPYKKARIMEHWIKQIGGVNCMTLEVESPESDGA